MSDSASGQQRVHRVETATLSVTGDRSDNEDRIAVCELGSDVGCWALADGLGGHRGGAVAAELATRAAIDSFRSDPAATTRSVEACFTAADAAVRRGQIESAGTTSMRTTLVLLLLDENGVAWGHVGDSRLYHFKDRAITHQTRDHSIPQVLVDAGELTPSEIRGHPLRNRLSRALGNEAPAKPVVATSSVVHGDAFLLCSDGFWENVVEDELLAELATATTAQAWLQTLDNRLQNRVLSGSDNRSAIALFVR